MLLRDKRLMYIQRTVNRVIAEEERQYKKWGVQDVSPEKWMLWVTEEVGETAQAINDHYYGEGVTKEEVISEATQAATLLLKIAEMYDDSIPEYDEMFQTSLPEGGEGE